MNAWIDFNGDGQWQPEERVMDVALTGYQNINYHGSMHTESVTQVPAGAVRPTWIRVNLGYGYDPNDPCEQNWYYGNVWDMQVLSSVKVAELWSVGDAPIENVKNPVWKGEYDQHGVLLKEAANEPTTWTLRSGQFSFQVLTLAFPAGIGTPPKISCEYTFTGINLNSTLKSTTDAFTGWSGTVTGNVPRQIGKYSLKLVFRITDNTDKPRGTQTILFPLVYVIYGPPTVQNPPSAAPKQAWYEKAVEWASGDSDPDRIALDVMKKAYAYAKALGMLYRNVPVAWDRILAGAVDRANCLSMANLWCNVMRVLGVPGVDTHRDYGGLNLGFISAKNLPAFDGVPGYGRESYLLGKPDRWVWDSHVYGRLGDKDYDPTLGLSRSSADRSWVAWDLTNKVGHGLVNVLPGQDFQWAQGIADCVELIKDVEAHGDDEGAWPHSLYDVVSCPAGLSASPQPLARIRAGGAHFTGTASEEPLDSDGDGLGNTLVCTAQVENTVGGSFYVRAALLKGNTLITTRDSITSIFSTLYRVSPAIGTNPVRVHFSGEDIFARAVDGPYRIRLTLVDTGAAVIDTLSVTTQAYNHASFGELPARLSQVTEQGQDLNGDGKYDYLQVGVTLQGSRAGRYWIEASLFSAGTVITTTGSQVNAAVGSTSATLRLSGKEISAFGIDGPYQLSVSVVDTASVQVVNSIQSTKSYHAADFQPSGVSFTGSFNSHAVDTNSNGRFDFLRLDVGLTLDSSGVYQVAAWLQDTTGKDVSLARWSGALGAGAQTVSLDFSGQDVNRQGKNQPYKVSYALAARQGGPPLAWRYNPHTTAILPYASFEPWVGTLVNLTGHYADHGIDTDGDGLYDSLAVTIGVSVADSGVVWALGRLTDGDGNTLAQAVTPVFSAPTPSGNALLLFDGRRIFGARTNGPYRVKSLHLYHAGAPDEDITVDDAYTTSGYQFTAFEKAATVAGTVTDSIGKGIPGAVVFMSGGDVQYTLAGGKYHLVAFKDSTYTVKVRGPEGVPGPWWISVGGQVIGLGDSTKLFLKVGELTQVSFRAPVIVSDVPAKDRPLPHEFGVYQNYPNPFNPSTVIEYDLPRMSHVRLSVFDPLGREVALLVDGTVEAGHHEVRFNAAGLASGIYIYRLQASQFTASRKMLVVR